MPDLGHGGLNGIVWQSSDKKVALTNLGGIAVKMTNKTAAASVKGTLVIPSPTTDNAFTTAGVSAVDVIGVVFEAGVADASECWVVIYGIAQVLLKDATSSTHGNWVETSDAAGRANATNASPAAAPEHFQEIGHCIESKGADTDVLAKIVLHFN